MSAAPSALLSAIRQQSSTLNLRPLQRLDPLTQSVVFTGKHSVLYRLARASEQWERDNVEGPFFIVERAAAPRYQLVILNRLSLQAWMMPLTPSTRFELQEEQYLFIQSGADVVGVWFYEPTDAQHAAHTLHQLTPLANHTVHQPDTAGRATKSVTTASSTAESVKVRAARPSILAPVGKRLHSQPPPPPTLPLSDAVDGVSEAELQNRLRAFLSAFKAEDAAYSEAHREAVIQQSSNKGLEVAKSDTAEGAAPLDSVPLPLHTLFHAATLESSLPLHTSSGAERAALTVAELEGALVAERATQYSHSASKGPSTGQLHPLVSQLFQQSADTAQRKQQPALHYPTSLQARPTLPSSLSSPSLLSHTSEPPASLHPSTSVLLTPTSFAAVPFHVVGAARAALPRVTASVLHLAFPSLPVALTRTAFIRHLHEALSDERTAADLHRQYIQQQQPDSSTAHNGDM